MTLTIALSFAALLAIHHQPFPLPTAAYGLGIVLSIEGGVAVKDKAARRSLRRVYLVAWPACCVVGLAAALEANRSVSDAAFLLIIFLARGRTGVQPAGACDRHVRLHILFHGCLLPPVHCRAAADRNRTGRSGADRACCAFCRASR